MSAVFEIERLLREISETRRYVEFLRRPAMSAGVYVLPAGASDLQTPHREDEIYYVVRGTAKLRLGPEERPVYAGDVIFVEAGLEHRFFDIENELAVLVVFAPAESAES